MIGLDGARRQGASCLPVPRDSSFEDGVPGPGMLVTLSRMDRFVCSDERVDVAEGPIASSL